MGVFTRTRVGSRFWLFKLTGLWGIGSPPPGAWWVWVIVAWGLMGSVAYGEYDAEKESVYVQIILTEAAGESLDGQIAVAEVLRNRHWSTRGFAGIKRADLRSFLSDCTPMQFELARVAYHRARGGSSIAQGATHFESTDFPTPWWVTKKRKGKPVTVFVKQMGKHRFYRELPE